MIELRFATLELTEAGAITRFPDGSQYGALPHDTADYHVIADRCGYEDDILRYAQEHELAHHCLAEAFGCHSPVLWALAHDEKPTPMIAAAEEALVLDLQAYVRANLRPFVAGVDWPALKRRFIGLLEPQDEGDRL